MTQNDFILQYVAAKIAGRAIQQNISLAKEPLAKSVKATIQEAEWVWEALPNELKTENIKK